MMHDAMAIPSLVVSAHYNLLSIHPVFVYRRAVFACNTRPD